MAELTTDPNDPRLGHGTDPEPIPQHDVYLVLSKEERAKGLVRPLEQRYIHAAELGGCGVVTKMGYDLSETYARNPNYYGSTYCEGCRMHNPVGINGEFYWCDNIGKPLQYEGERWRVGT